MSGSAVVAVRKAVIEDLATLTGSGGALEDVTVQYAWRRGVNDREQVFTNAARGTTPAAALKAGRNHRQEEGRFELVVLVEVPGGLGEEADQRALDIGAVVEERIADRKNNEYGVTGLSWIRVESWTLTPRSGDHGSFSELVYTVLYSARLT